MAWKILKGVLKTFMCCLVCVVCIWLFFNLKISFLWKWLQVGLRVGLLLVAAGCLVGVVWYAALKPVASIVKGWRAGRKRMPIIMTIIISMLVILIYNFGHWSRVPEYDSYSPDGRYKVEVSITNYDIQYFIPGWGGDGGCHESRVRLVELTTGRILGEGRVDWLNNVRDIRWYTDEVVIARGGGLRFKLPQ